MLIFYQLDQPELNKSANRNKNRTYSVVVCQMTISYFSQFKIQRITMLSFFFYLTFSKVIEVGKITYKLNEAARTASVGTGENKTCTLEGDIVIPDFIQDNGIKYNITEISDYAFQNSLITRIKIPEIIERVGNYSFNECKLLKGDAPISVNTKYIGDSAFNNCFNLSRFKIPTGIKEIGTKSFAACNNTVGNLVLPKTLRVVPRSCFYNCRLLNGSLTIPYGVERIENFAFEKCENLSGVLIIPITVNFIGRSAFIGCTKLSGSIILPKGITAIHQYSFRNCESFDASLVIPDGVTIIEYRAFFGCKRLSGDVIIPESVSVIQSEAFFGCENINSITIKSKNLSVISKSVFYSCTNVASLVLCDSIKEIQEDAFFGLSKIGGDLVLPLSIETISARAFKSTKYDSLTYLGNNTNININETAFTKIIKRITVSPDFPGSTLCNITVTKLPIPTPKRTPMMDATIEPESVEKINMLPYYGFLGGFALLLVIFAVIVIVLRKKSRSQKDVSIISNSLL